MFLESLCVWKSLLVPYIHKNFARFNLFLHNDLDVASFLAGVNFSKKKTEARLASFLSQITYIFCLYAPKTVSLVFQKFPRCFINHGVVLLVYSRKWHLVIFFNSCYCVVCFDFFLRDSWDSLKLCPTHNLLRVNTLLSNEGLLGITQRLSPLL